MQAKRARPRNFGQQCKCVEVAVVIASVGQSKECVAGVWFEWLWWSPSVYIYALAAPPKPLYAAHSQQTSCNQTRLSLSSTASTLSDPPYPSTKMASALMHRSAAASAAGVATKTSRRSVVVTRSALLTNVPKVSVERVLFSGAVAGFCPACTRRTLCVDGMSCLEGISRALLAQPHKTLCPAPLPATTTGCQEPRCSQAAAQVAPGGL